MSSRSAVCHLECSEAKSRYLLINVYRSLHYVRSSLQSRWQCAYTIICIDFFAVQVRELVRTVRLFYFAGVCMRKLIAIVCVLCYGLVSQFVFKAVATTPAEVTSSSVAVCFDTKLDTYEGKWWCRNETHGDCVAGDLRQSDDLLDGIQSCLRDAYQFAVATCTAHAVCDDPDPPPEDSERWRWFAEDRVWVTELHC